MICKKDGKIKLYCKGADTTVFERLSPSSADLKELTTSHLNVRNHSISGGGVHCKGADTTVFERLSPNSADLKELTTSHLNVRNI